MKVSIQNFRCFRKLTSYEFQSSRLTLLRGHSGAGKSTVLESIRWCLFGSLRNIYPSGFTPTSSNKTFVTLEIMGLNITRSQSPESLTVLIPDYQNNQYITVTQDVAQKYIDSVFGNKDIWQASSFIRQNERCPLMTANNSERLSLLNEILFGSENSTPFENPDYYIEKIEEEVDKVAKEITGQTAVFNTYYSKYMSNSQSFENTYGWENMSLEKVQSYQQYIEEIKQQISFKTSEMIEISKLENKKKFLEDKIKTLQESNTNVDFNGELKEDTILELNTQLLSIQNGINKCIGDKTKYDSLQNELDAQNSNMTSNHQELLKLSSFELETQVKSLKSLIQELERKSSDIRMKDARKQTLKTQLESIINELNVNEEKLKTYSIQDVDMLKKILNNSLAYKSLKETQIKMSELKLEGDIIPEENLTEINTKFSNMLMNLKYSLQVCQKYGLELNDIKIKIEAYQKIIDFHKIQKEHLSNQKLFISKNEELEKLRKNLITDFTAYQSYLEPEEKEISASKIQSLIELINNRLGSPLKCPHCSCVVEYNNGVLSAPKNEIIDITVGKMRTEKLRELLNIVNRNSMIETMISKLENEIQTLQPFDEQIVGAKQYSEIEITSIQSLINECSRIETEFEEKDVGVIERKINNIKVLRDYYTLMKDFNKYQSEFNKEIPTSENTEELRNNILNLPIIQGNIERLHNNKEKFETELQSLNQEVSESYEEINLKINQHKIELKELEDKLYDVVSAHKLQGIISAIFSQMINIDITSITSENISRLESEKILIQNKINDTKHMINILKDYNKLKYELRDIILITSSQIIQSQIKTLNENLEQYNDMYSKAYTMYHLMNDRTELEKVRNLIIELTNKQSNLNIMKQIVIETTNSALEGLVATINNMTNSVLEELFDDSMVVELKLYKELKTGKNKIKPSVNLSAYYKGECFDNINNLSGGEQSRISLALTLSLASIHTSPIVFLDEVMGALNADLREQCVEVIKNFLIERSNKTILSVEHNFIVGLFDDSIEINH